MCPESRKRRKLPGKRRRPQSTPKGSTKPGHAYQDAVATVARTLFPKAVVEVGTWVDGPDGRRDLDVVVRPKTGAPPLVYLECKDWNRPIGIAFIDALESKRRDIGAGTAMICSNSGFTADALRKAARVEIPALAALIAGDSRIKVEITEQLYAPIIQFTEGTITFHGIPTEAVSRINAAGFGALTFNGKSMDRWLASKCFDVAVRSTHSRSFRVRCDLKRPLVLTLGAEGLLVPVTALEIRGAFTVRWFTKVHRIDASNGMYDYLKKRVVGRLSNFQFHIKDVNVDEWGTEVDVSEVPPWYLKSIYERKPEKNSMWVSLMLIKSLPGGSPSDAPDLSDYIEREESVD